MQLKLGFQAGRPQIPEVELGAAHPLLRKLNLPLVRMHRRHHHHHLRRLRLLLYQKYRRVKLQVGQVLMVAQEEMSLRRWWMIAVRR